MTTDADLETLLREVLSAPNNHTGVRSDPDGLTARRYVAKRLNVDLLERIRAALG